MKYILPLLTLLGVLVACSAEEDEPIEKEAEEYFEGIATTFEGKEV